MECFPKQLLRLLAAWKSIKLHALTRLLFAVALSSTAVQGRAAVIGSVSGCIENPQYTFCTAKYSAPVSGNSWSFDVLFGDGVYIEPLVSNPVQVGLFPALPVNFFYKISDFLVSLLGEDGSPLSTPSFSPQGPFDERDELDTRSSTAIAVGTKIRGLHAQMTCSLNNLPEGVPDPCASGHTFDTLTIKVSGNGLEDATLRVGRLPPVTEAPEPAGGGLMLIALALAAITGIRRTEVA